MENTCSIDHISMKLTVTKRCWLCVYDIVNYMFINICVCVCVCDKDKIENDWASLKALMLNGKDSLAGFKKEIQMLVFHCENSYKSSHQFGSLRNVIQKPENSFVLVQYLFITIFPFRLIHFVSTSTHMLLLQHISSDVSQSAFCALVKLFTQ